MDPIHQMPSNSIPTSKPIDQSQDRKTVQGIPVRFVKDDGSIRMGSKMAVSMPYDMIGCSLTEALEKMQKASRQLQ